MAAESTQSAGSEQSAKAAPQSEDSSGVGVREKATSDTEPSRVGRADAIIHRNVLWSAGAGLVPVPVFDIVALTGVQLKMVNELANLYEQKFSEGIVKSILTSLVSSLGGVAIGGTLGASLAKVVPILGTTLGVITLPVFAGAFTYATGKVFLMHFEAGGTILDLDPQAMRAYFKREFEKGKEVVSKVREAKADPTD